MNHKGYGLQLYQNQSTPKKLDELADPVPNRPIRLRKISNFFKTILKEKGIQQKKQCMISSPDEGDMTKTSLGAPNLKVLPY